MTWLPKILGFAKSVPWFVWAGLAVLAAWGVDRTVQYRSGYSDGRESVLAELRTAEAKAAQEALEAASKADIAAASRADQNATVIAEQIRKIEEAEAKGGNPLDELF